MDIRLNRPLKIGNFEIDNDMSILELIEEDDYTHVQTILDEINTSKSVVAYKLVLFKYFQLLVDIDIVELHDKLNTDTIHVIEEFIRYLINNEYKLVIKK